MIPTRTGVSSDARPRPTGLSANLREDAGLDLIQVLAEPLDGHVDLPGDDRRDQRPVGVYVPMAVDPAADELSADVVPQTVDQVDQNHLAVGVVQLAIERDQVLPEFPGG